MNGIVVGFSARSSDRDPTKLEKNSLISPKPMVSQRKEGESASSSLLLWYCRKSLVGDSTFGVSWSVAPTWSLSGVILAGSVPGFDGETEAAAKADFGE